MHRLALAFATATLLGDQRELSRFTLPLRVKAGR